MVPQHTLLVRGGCGMGVGKCILLDEEPQGNRAEHEGPKVALGLLWSWTKLLACFFSWFNQYCLNPCQGVGERGLWRGHGFCRKPRLRRSHWVLGNCSAQGGFPGPCGRPVGPHSLLGKIKAAVSHTGHQEALQSQENSGPRWCPRAPIPHEVSRIW